MSLQATEPRVVLDKRVQLGEGSLWDDRNGILYWVDIAGKTLHRFDPAHARDAAVDIGEQVTTVVPTERGNHVIVGLENSVAIVDPKTGERIHEVALEADYPENRCNDGKCGPRGRFYIGTMSTVRRPGSASLYRVNPDLSIETCFGGVTVSNGIVWSSDERTVYYIDTSTTGIDRIDHDPETGELTNRRKIIDVPAEYGKPDGMTIDQEGRLWVAMFHGACVTVWDPHSGELVEKIDVPAKNITSVAFGGEQLSTLYITTAAIGLNPEDFNQYPSSGTLLAFETNTQGRPAYRFGSAEHDTEPVRRTVSESQQTESQAESDNSERAYPSATATTATNTDTPDEEMSLEHSLDSPGTDEAAAESSDTDDDADEELPPLPDT